jgi:hypothetical protein
MPRYDPRKERVAINSKQYFSDVSPGVWQFKIGSYEVCKKWLSERKGRVLSATDCGRFSGIADAIEATLAEQRKIDQVISKHGGWPDAFVGTAGGDK